LEGDASQCVRENRNVSIIAPAKALGVKPGMLFD
jgi:hypothetical protein